MKLYTKDGVTTPANHIVIHRGGSQIINPSLDEITADGWEEITSLPKSVEDARDVIRQEIIECDSSPFINVFYVDGIPLWLDKATRTGLMLRFQAEQMSGKEETTLWSDGVQFTLPLATAMQMLYALEVYASACYDKTQHHLATIAKLDTMEALMSYNYKLGYPDKLHFGNDTLAEGWKEKDAIDWNAYLLIE